ncbi:hypothetical protein PF005_g27284 [Phytophthora fragariae]|nr:hypothetical protein PF003_g3882 [Phytophthora fragariae]KAE8921787.1 hypothetical protein PF009_g27940 [Phytophthora fragariae]KAE8970901.1 hypothetical protein PF011_g26239 [Phytophthora fragariae]KAE9068443.1 hypothetical protein PF010_g27067 [Phytophthora fragariae]KAE9171105.1 hypothetical protein PF005_g27284 [Phytophthora fragariae]
MINAASKGFLDIVKYLHVNLGQAASNAAIIAAARTGHLSVVQYLDENHSERCMADPIAVARANGHDEVVDFLLEHEECRRALEAGRFMDRAEESDTTKKVSKLSEDAVVAAAESRDDLEARLRVEVEASIRVEEEARIRAEVEAAIRAEQEEAMLRAKIRAEIQDEVEDKMRAEIRAELLAQKKSQPCTICFGRIDDPITTLCCHTFCAGCLAKWRSGGHELCPICRSSLN